MLEQDKFESFCTEIFGEDPEEGKIFRKWPLSTIYKWKDGWMLKNRTRIFISYKIDDDGDGRCKRTEYDSSSPLPNSSEYVWIVLPPIRNFDLEDVREDDWENEKKYLILFATFLGLNFGIKTLT